MRKVTRSVWWFTALVAVAAGCHREEQDAPLFERKISIADKFYDVRAFDAKHTIVVGYAGKILTTEDGGDSWSRQTSGTNLYLFAIDFVDQQDGWVVGDRSTYLHTKDGGKTWQLAKIGNLGEMKGDEAMLADEPILYDVQFLDANTGWIVGEFGHIYHTTDAGRTWKGQEESLIGGGLSNALDLPTFFGVHFIDPINGVAVGLDSKVARTHDGGATWKFDPFAPGMSLADPLYQPFQFPDTTAWAVGAAGVTVRQMAAGKPWEKGELGMEINTWLRAVNFLDRDNGWIVGGYGLILHTTDGGKTWLPSFG